MKISEHLRFLGFEVYDWLSGGTVAKHLEDLSFFFNDAISGDHINSARVAALLDHSSNSVSFYSGYKKIRSLEEFPVIQKTDFKHNYDAMISTYFDREKLFTATTSGSYGTPTKYLMTIDKYWRRFAEIVYFNRWAGYEIGMRHALTRTIPKSKFKRLLENEIIIYPANIDEGWLADKWSLLNKHKPSFLISYPSILMAMAGYILRNQLEDITKYIKGIVSISEPLLDEDRRIIENAFGCLVLGRYSCEEFGVLAHECLLERKYHLNSASYKIEILALDGDRPVMPGESGRVIVTDLFSHAMPLIRYDTGDVAVLGKDCPCGLRTPVLERIEGRQTEIIYDTKGRMVSPLAMVTPIARTIEGIFQFQFIQKGQKKYCLKIVPMRTYPYDRAFLIKEKLLTVLGPEAEIDFEYLDSIKPLPSGKRPYIINNYNII